MRCTLIIAVCVLLAVSRLATGQSLPSFDFTRPADCAPWRGLHDVGALEHTPEGLRIPITGADPYIAGPALDLPEGQDLWLNLRLKSERDGGGQVFYYNTGPAERNSVHFTARAGRWETVRLAIPPLGKRFHLRIDPPGTDGSVILASLSFEKRVALAAPAWPVPGTPAPEANWLTIRSGDASLAHGKGIGQFVLGSRDKSIATGFDSPLVGYLQGEEVRWLNLKQAARVDLAREGEVIVLTATAQDADGATWRFVQRFAPATPAGGFDVTAEVTVDRDRSVVFLPMLLVLPGKGSFGTGKAQAIFPGLEYLDKDEPSSSEADIIGPGSRRQVPDSLKITFPVISLAAGGTYAAMIWDKSDVFAAVFDSPDRLFKSDAHVMGVIFPGSNGADRTEGSLLPWNGSVLKAGQALPLRATLLAGPADAAIEGIRQYVARRGLAPLPDRGMDQQAYVRLAAAGWLDSKTREGNQFRHAWPGQFQPHAAADAAWMIDQLAAASSDAALSQRLRESAAAALAQVPPASWNYASVGHVRYPVASLYYGHVAENAAQARRAGRDMLRRFQPDGSIIYRPGEVDYGKTHFSREANGLTSAVVASVLEMASVSGDGELIREGLRVLRALDKFMNTAPRGAQTWECPLHTPDILASAHLVKAYVRGYELSGDEKLLESARYWAWTGVPFVYLTNPVADQPVGPYATIAVFGATSWVAPNWMGMPVQWCGINYADSLYDLARHDPSGPWKQIAQGIAISGMQQTFPMEDAERKGMLPDSVSLRAGVRNNPAINPGTVQAQAMRQFGQVPYSFRSYRKSGLLLHAPGQITDEREEAGAIHLKVAGCMKESYRVLISGCRRQPTIRINSQPTTPEYNAEGGWTIVQVKGDAAIDVAP